MRDLIITYWQFALVALLIVFTAVVNIVYSKKEVGLKFTTGSMPEMKPIAIRTKDCGFWGGVWTWIMVTRKWELTKDWNYSIDSGDGIEELTIPKGFIFDGASVPKFFRSWLSPMGVLLIGGLVHDYGYKYQTLLKKDKCHCNGVKSQKHMDEIFRDININVNGFRTINNIAYLALRLGGFFAWKGHRKNGLDWKSSVK